jgi:hypothetical protein
LKLLLQKYNNNFKDHYQESNKDSNKFLKRIKMAVKLILKEKESLWIYWVKIRIKHKAKVYKMLKFNY